MTQQDCIFCKIGAGQVPSAFLYRDDRCFVVRDIHPRAPTHLLVIPQRHVGAVTGLSAGDEPLLGHLLAVAGQVARHEGLTERGYRIVVNQGADAGQEVAHLHVHVLGGRGLGAMG